MLYRSIIFHSCLTNSIILPLENQTNLQNCNSLKKFLHFSNQTTKNSSKLSIKTIRQRSLKSETSNSLLQMKGQNALTNLLTKSFLIISSFISCNSFQNEPTKKSKNLLRTMLTSRQSLNTFWVLQGTKSASAKVTFFHL